MELEIATRETYSLVIDFHPDLCSINQVLSHSKPIKLVEMVIKIIVSLTKALPTNLFEVSS